MRIWIIAGIALAAGGCEPPAPQEPAKPEASTGTEVTTPPAGEEAVEEAIEDDGLTPEERWARDHTLAPPEDPQLPF